MKRYSWIVVTIIIITICLIVILAYKNEKAYTENILLEQRSFFKRDSINAEMISNIDSLGMQLRILEEHYKIIESNLELSIQNDSLIRLDVNKLRKEIRRNRDSYK